MAQLVYLAYNTGNRKTNLYVSVLVPVEMDKLDEFVNGLVDNTKFLTGAITNSEREQIQAWYDTHNTAFEANRQKYDQLKDKIASMESKNADAEKIAPLQVKLEKMKEALKPIAEAIHAVDGYLKYKGKKYPRRQLINTNFTQFTGLEKLKNGQYLIRWQSS